MTTPLTTAKQLEQILASITDNAPDNEAFLEQSREREKAYARNAVNRWLEILHILEKRTPIQRCLDVGTSPLTFVLPRYCSEVETLDYTTAFRTRCESANIKLHAGGLNWQNDILPDESYDCIIFLEVIEHLHMNPEKVISFLKRKLRPGGLLILTTPNLMWFGNRIKMLFNLRLAHLTYPPFNQEEGNIHGFQHDRVYSPAEMKQYFRNTGWSSFSLGYHRMNVCDSTGSFSTLKRIAHIPVQILKRLVPSTRQQMLIIAKK